MPLPALVTSYSQDIKAAIESDGERKGSSLQELKKLVPELREGRGLKYSDTTLLQVLRQMIEEGQLSHPKGSAGGDSVNTSRFKLAK